MKRLKDGTLWPLAFPPTFDRMIHCSGSLSESGVYCSVHGFPQLLGMKEGASNLADGREDDRERSDAPRTAAVFFFGRKPISA